MMNATGYLERVSDGVKTRPASLADLWRAISSDTPENGQPVAGFLCLFPDPDAPAGLVRIVGADEKLLRRIHRHMRKGGSLYDLVDAQG